MIKKKKIKIGIYGLTGCAGDQLAILNCEEQLIKIFEEFEIVNFLMAQSNNLDEDVDIALVEGSVSTDKDAEFIKRIREKSQKVVAIGVCSAFGGIQAMLTDTGQWQQAYENVYPEVEISCCNAIQPSPIDAFVSVDYYLPGCPISKEQVLLMLSRILKGYQPEFPMQSVCVECKYRENDCLLNKNIMCLGPITTGGCRAICPSCNLACVGCFGIYEDANTWSQFNLLLDKGFNGEMIIARMKNFSGTKLNTFISKLKEQKV